MPESLFQEGKNCCAVARAERVAFLVDADAYFRAFRQAAERAERSILILAWDFDSRTPLGFDAEGEPQPVGEFLNRLVARNRHLHVRILDWDYPMVFGAGRELPPIYGINWKPHRRIAFRYDDTHPVAGSHHQKIVVVDDKLAFAGGLDLTSKRWDTPAHAPHDPRRTAGGTPYPPFHDVMVAVDGEAAEALAQIARERWHKATGKHVPPVQTRSDPWPPEMTVVMRETWSAVACTSPPMNGDPAVHHVEALYLDMIAAAKRTIYIENQYFTSGTIGQALRKRLEEPDGPEIVLVTRLLSHGWLEEATMHVLRTRLVRELRAADRHGRFHAYYPHVEGLAEGTCIDLHSKVMVVDDRWLRAGSSNLSNRSMGMDTECDVALEVRGEPGIAAAILALRDGLLAEHLGCAREDVERELARSGSLAGAIAALARNARRLEVLEAPELSEAALSMASVGDLEQPIPLDTMVQEISAASGEDPREERREKRHRRIVVGGVAATVVALALMWRYTPLADLVSAQNAMNMADAFAGHWWAPIALMAAYMPAILVMFPRWIITLAGVLAFGPWLGFSYAMAGMLIASVLSYLPGRLARRDTVRRLAGARLNRLSDILRKRGVIAVTIVKLVPVAPFAVVNFVMGAMRIRFVQFLVGSTIAYLPGTFAATVLSDQVATGLVHPHRINPWLIGVAVAVLAALAFGGHRWLKRQPH